MPRMNLYTPPQPLNTLNHFSGFVGRIKTQLIKRTTHELVSRYGGEFKDNFEENKTVVSRYLDVSSKKMRNTIAGYVTRLKKTENR